jgi:hypothetical protein
MEQNLFNALHDKPTLVELVVLVLYAQAVTHPYMRRVRGPGTDGVNMLNLGPFHQELKDFLQTIIENPDLLIGPNATYDLGTLDGEEWQNPAVMKLIYGMLPDLPNLKPLLVAFFKGTAETWERFTSEFAPGGVIDLATADQRAKAWIPATNDICEGALGSYRLYHRNKPTASSLVYNAQARYHKNNTEEFMRKEFKPEDHDYVHVAARHWDEQGIDKKIRGAHVAHFKQIAEENAKREAERAAKRQQEAERMAGIDIVYDEGAIREMSVRELTDQIERWRSLNVVKNIPLKSHLKLKAEKLAELIRILKEYQEGQNASEIGSADPA